MRYVILLLLGSVTLSAQQAVPSHAVARPLGRAATEEVARVNGVVLTSLRLQAALSRLIPMESFHRNVTASKVDELRAQALERPRVREQRAQPEADEVRGGFVARDQQQDREGEHLRRGQAPALVLRQHERRDQVLARLAGTCLPQDPVRKRQF